MARIKLAWWLPIAACIVVGIVALIPANTAESGRFLPYQSLIPWAPISSIIIWLAGFLLYFLGRGATERPMRPQSW
ncbi:MAG: hypothetical protein V3S51_06970 [Dehalococcoidia bacterium]